MSVPRVSSLVHTGRHLHEAAAADTGRAGERVDNVWTFRAMSAHIERRRLMYRITGHYPVVSPAGRCYRKGP
jgi:hypothetical protein